MAAKLVWNLPWPALYAWRFVGLPMPSRDQAGRYSWDWYAPRRSPHSGKLILRGETSAEAER